MADCALCLQEAKLKDSHVLPAFVFRWLRQRSVTGHIRNTKNINRRIQDGLKKPWLCGGCEQLLSRDEQAFATKVFGPYLRETTRVEYGPWLLRFCTSISWRVLKHAKGLNAEHRYTPEEESAAAKAEAVWRDFLHGRRQGVGSFEQHLLPLDIIESTTVPDLAENINRYLTGYVDMDIAGTSKTMMTYAKLGRFVVFGMIRKGRGPWEGTRVNAQHGYLEPRKYVVPQELIWFFNDRARHVRASVDAMSAAQTAKVEAAFLANIDSAVGSEQVRAMLADARLFGDDAIIRRS